MEGDGVEGGWRGGGEVCSDRDRDVLLEGRYGGGEAEAWLVW